MSEEEHPVICETTTRIPPGVNMPYEKPQEDEPSMIVRWVSPSLSSRFFTWQMAPAEVIPEVSSHGGAGRKDGRQRRLLSPHWLVNFSGTTRPLATRSEPVTENSGQ